MGIFLPKKKEDIKNNNADNKNTELNSIKIEKKVLKIINKSNTHLFFKFIIVIILLFIQLFYIYSEQIIRIIRQKMQKIYKFKIEERKITYRLDIIYEFKEFFNEIPTYNHSHKTSNYIFWCWFEGENQAPQLSKACLNSIRKNCKNHEIIIITEENMNKYVHFPVLF